MDKTSLVADDLEAGRHFVAALEQAGMPIAVAMWFRKTLSDDWMLGIATPDVANKGPLAVIRFADAVRRNGFAESISRDQISYFNTSTQFFSGLPFPEGDVRDDVLTIEHFSLNGAEIDRALVFHVAEDLRSSRRVPRTPPRKKQDTPYRAA